MGTAELIAFGGNFHMNFMRLTLVSTLLMSTAGCTTIIDGAKGQYKAISKAINGQDSSVVAVTANDAQPMSYRLNTIKKLSVANNAREEELASLIGWRTVADHKNAQEVKLTLAAPQPDLIGEGNDKKRGPITAKTLNDTDQTTFSRLYVQGRATETKDYCSLYFDGLSQLSRASEYGRETTSNLFSLSSVILGVTGAAAEQLAILAGTQAFISTQWDNYNRFQFLMPGPHLVRAKVFQAMAEYERAHPISGIQNFYQTNDWVRDYATTCTELGIKAIIDKDFTPKPVEFADAYRAQNENLQLGELSRKLKESMNILGLQHLYWKIVLLPTDAEEAAALDKMLKVSAPIASETLAEKLKAAAETTKGEDGKPTTVPTRSAKEATQFISEIRTGLGMLGGYNNTGAEATKLKEAYAKKAAEDVQKAKAQIESIAKALGGYKKTQNKFPADLKELTKDGNDPKLTDDDLKDPWGNPVYYQPTETGVKVGTRGADGKEGGTGANADQEQAVQ